MNASLFLTIWRFVCQLIPGCIPKADSREKTPKCGEPKAHLIGLSRIPRFCHARDHKPAPMPHRQIASHRPTRTGNGKTAWTADTRAGKGKLPGVFQACNYKHPSDGFSVGK